MSIESVMSAAVVHDEDWLRDALQAAVELEFFTIPPYLTAMWSVRDPDHEAARVIRSVVYEEMEHMALACNLLVAVDGTPVINRPPAVPEYPNPLPGGVKPDLTIVLQGMSPAANAVFMALEAPEEPIAFPRRETEAPVRPGEAFPRIGAFYDAIEAAFRSVRWPLRLDRQLTGPLANLVVANMADVHRAVDTIRSQGEGTSLTPVGIGGDIAHYYRFEQFARGERLLPDRASPLGFSWGAALPFPDVFPVAKVPAGGHRPAPDDPAAPLLDAFDQTYTRMLDALQSAWAGGGQAALYLAIELMFALQGPARALMALPVPGGIGTYGPNFRYRPDLAASPEV